MQARQPISVAASYEVDRSISQRIIMVLLPNCTCRILLIEMLGVAVIKTDQVLPPTSKQGQTTHRRQSEDDEDDEDMSEEEVQADPVKILKEEAKFDMVTVWGHDRLPAADDNFIKGIEEWIAFAEAVCISRDSLPKADRVLQIHTGKTDIPQSSDSAPC